MTADEVRSASPATMNVNQPFAAPRESPNLADCYFYHVMDLPGYGKVGNEWDLRGAEEAYLGGVSFQGKRVLELGTASGFLCRYMEQHGADVFGFDLGSDQSWDLVPFAKFDMFSFAEPFKGHIEKLKNGWWFTHRLFESKAKVVYGNIYDIPKEIGLVDISTFGAILLHLRDPFHALFNALRLTRETVVVTDIHPEQAAASPFHSANPLIPRSIRARLIKRLFNRETKVHRLNESHSSVMYFIPNYRGTDPSMAVTWWCLPPSLICEFLGVLGFEKTVVTEHFQTFQGKKARMYTVVGSRTQPLAE